MDLFCCFIVCFVVLSRRLVLDASKEEVTKLCKIDVTNNTLHTIDYIAAAVRFISRRLDNTN